MIAYSTNTKRNRFGRIAPGNFGVFVKLGSMRTLELNKKAKVLRLPVETAETKLPFAATARFPGTRQGRRSEGGIDEWSRRNPRGNELI